MILLDTSFLAGLGNPKDAHHAAARNANVRLASGAWGQGLVLEYVFLETTSVLLQRAGRASAQAAGHALLRSDELILIACSGLWDSAWQGFASQTDTTLSLCDIAIVQFALEHAAGRVLGFDQEFRKIPGITLLPALTRQTE